MGYYVCTIDNDLFLSKDHFDDVYKKMCDLNEHDELKRGGQSPETPKEDGQKWNPNKWFSWMAYNYPQTCANMFEILQQIGFDYTLDNEGNLVGLSYEYNKTGQEEYFLTCFNGYMRPGSWIEFKGEEEEDYYRYVWTDFDMQFERAVITKTFINVEVMKFGEMTAMDKELAKWREEYKKQAQKELID